MTENEAKSYALTIVFVTGTAVTIVRWVRAKRAIAPIRQQQKEARTKQEKFDRQWEEFVSNH